MLKSWVPIVDSRGQHSDRVHELQVGVATLSFAKNKKKHHCECPSSNKYINAGSPSLSLLFPTCHISGLQAANGIRRLEDGCPHLNAKRLPPTPRPPAPLINTPLHTTHQFDRHLHTLDSNMCMVASHKHLTENQRVIHSLCLSLCHQTMSFC